ncbi:GIY-YIG nuclease family protein [Belliella sp. DSM 107340]|uniref:GIY-YIG nuclease family protein n=2 Tax=Belliella calami TaxID=2923436 RepID=A0ABS9UVD1_9BACT|nr:GIY-YIG nuclease family protein [Belliella calami]MCH7400208.1 GIY-YIG nuclease family protein [Belliella calami]
MFFVYAISSSIRKYIYVGLTSNLDERIHRHNSGYEKTTKPYTPFDLIYVKQFETRIEARQHEKYLKSTSGKRILYSLL